MVAWLPVRPGSDEMRDECYRQLSERRNRLRGDSVKPGHGWAFQCGGESPAVYRVLIPMQLHLILIGIEVVDGILNSIECFHLWHSEFGLKRVA